MADFVYVRQMAEDNNLELLAGGSGLDAKIWDDMISRPGLEFAGYGNENGGSSVDGRSVSSGGDRIF